MAGSNVNGVSASPVNTAGSNTLGGTPTTPGTSALTDAGTTAAPSSGTAALTSATNLSSSEAALASEIQTFEQMLLQQMEASMLAANTEALSDIGSTDSDTDLFGSSDEDGLDSSTTGSGLLDASSGFSPYSTEAVLSALLTSGLGSSGLGNSSAGTLTDDTIPVDPDASTGALSASAMSALAAAAPATTSDTTISQSVAQAAAKYGVPAGLITAVIEQESGMNPNAVSPAGAMGLMQLMPSTAAEMGVTNPLDPAQNIDAGTHYLSQLIAQVDGNIPLALAAYNAGPGAVEQYGGIPPYPETQNYVEQVMQKWQALGGGSSEV